MTTSSGEKVIRKKLRWYDSCDLSEDEAHDAITRCRNIQPKRYISCALCPQCFVHLSDLQHHQEAYHNSRNGGETMKARYQQEKPEYHKTRRNHVSFEDEELMPGDRYFDAEDGLGDDESNSLVDEQEDQWRSSRSRSNSIENRQSKRPTSVPPTPSPQLNRTSNSTAVPHKYYRCNVCLELFPTHGGLRLHKTLSDHHELPDCCGNNGVKPRSRYNAKALPQTYASQVIQGQLESFLAAKNLAKKTHISVRVVSSLKKSFEVSSFVQNLFQMSSPRVECSAKTYFLFERFGNVDVIIFAMFVQEFDDDAPVPNRRRAFISNFGAPGFLQGINDNLHSEIFCQFLLSYLNYTGSLGFEQVYFSQQMVAESNNDSPGVFNCENSIKFRNEWLMSVFNDAKNEQLAYIGNFRTLADYRHYCRDTSEDERRFPLFIFDNLRGEEIEWSAKIEQSAVRLLRKHRNEWIELDRSASRDIASRTMADVLMYDLLGGHQFIVINVQPPSKRNRDALPPRSALDADDSDDYFYVKRPRFLSTPRRFLAKCQQRNWRFDTLELAISSTAQIVKKIGSVYFQHDV